MWQASHSDEYLIGDDGLRQSPGCDGDLILQLYTATIKNQRGGTQSQAKCNHIRQVLRFG